MSPVAERDTRELIVKSARDLIVAGGLDALSMRKVGQMVGVSATAIYRHFEDKDALLSAAVSRGAQIFGNYLVDALREPTPLLRLQRMGQRYFDFATEHGYEYQILFMTDCTQSKMLKLDTRAQEETNSTFRLLVDRVSECQGSGDIEPGDPNHLALYIWSSLHGLASLRILGRIAVDAEPFQILVLQQLDRTLLSLRPHPSLNAVS